MKKIVAPFILFVLALAVIVYLKLDTSMGSSNFDAESYLKARTTIDSLEISLWENQDRPDLQIKIRDELSTAWKGLSEMQATAAPVSDDNVGGLSGKTWVWVVGGVAAIGVIFFILVVILGHGKKALTRKLAAITGSHRFKEPKNGFENDPTIVPPRPRPQKRSIIDDATEFAENQKRLAANQVVPPTIAGMAPPAEAAPSHIAFEDENGVPENKILTANVGEERPHLRPTSKERITSAMQNLSDVLLAPRGMSREHTMKLRAQSHNLTGSFNVAPKSTPLDTNRFDREFTIKSKIMQMARRGFPASAIASQMKIPQDQVEAIIKGSQEAGN